MRTQVFPQNVRGMQFYERQGFSEKMKTIEVYLQNSIDRLREKNEIFLGIELVIPVALEFVRTNPKVVKYFLFVAHLLRIQW